MTFSIDPRISMTCIELTDWPLSRILLKDNVDYPWLILVPRVPDIQEIDHLSKIMQHQLMDEISQLSLIVRRYFKPDKLNIGALGNIVSQLHIHVVARYTHDKLWPHGIWQTQQTDVSYPKEALLPLKEALLGLMQNTDLFATASSDRI